MKISDFILMSDVDGTLIMDGEIIPQNNIDALRRFTGGGGRFSISTGRSTAYAGEIARQLPVNFPCVVFNGGAIYDFQKNRYLMEEYLPEDAKGYLNELMQRFPGASFTVANNEFYYDVSDEKGFAQHSRSKSRYPYHRKASVMDLGGQWFKVVMLVDLQMAPDFWAFVESRAFPGVRFVYTNETMIEMLPETSSKAKALEGLMELEEFGRENLICIGDYYNDLEMIQLAGIGVTLETSPEDIRSQAQIIVCPCEDGAVADLVRRLEDTYGY